MFTKSSRYFNLPTVLGQDRHGRQVEAVKLRRLPRADGATHVVRDGDQLDAMSERLYRDATGFWRIADANGDLEAETLVGDAGRSIKVTGT